MQEIEYKVMLLNPNSSNPQIKKLLESLKTGSTGVDGLNVATGAYQTELTIATGMPDCYFKVGNNPICVAFTKENSVLGFITIGIDARTATLYTEHVYVRPEVRHKGVYKLMMERVKKFAKDTKCERIMSFVFDKNRDSKKVHAKVGFKKTISVYMMEVKDEQCEPKEN